MSDRSEFADTLAYLFEANHNNVCTGNIGGRFVAREKFAAELPNTGLLAPINYRSRNLKRWFLNGGGKIEELEPTWGAILGYRTLSKNTCGRTIVGIFRDEEISTAEQGCFHFNWRIETSLARVHATMTQLERHGHDIAPSVFFVRDKGGTLRTVIARRLGDGWYIYAFRLGAPLYQGWRVFWEDHAEL